LRKAIFALLSLSLYLALAAPALAANFYLYLDTKPQFSLNMYTTTYPMPKEPVPDNIAWLYSEGNRQDLLAVKYAVAWDIFVGELDPQYAGNPGNPYNYRLHLGRDITRAEFAAALARVLGFEEGNGTPWWEPYASYLKQNGVLEDDLVDVTDAAYWNEPIRRLQMARWMGRAARAFGADVIGPGLAFSDCSDPDALYATRVGWQGVPVVRGVGESRLNPDAAATRAEACLMLVRLARAMNQSPPGMEEMRDLHRVFGEWRDNLIHDYASGVPFPSWDPGMPVTPAYYRILTYVLGTVTDAAKAYGRYDPAGRQVIEARELVEAHGRFAVVKAVCHNSNSLRSWDTENWGFLVKRGGRWVFSGGYDKWENR
jgi:hypothetical protein